MNGLFQVTYPVKQIMLVSVHKNIKKKKNPTGNKWALSTLMIWAPGNAIYVGSGNSILLEAFKHRQICLQFREQRPQIHMFP